MAVWAPSFGDVLRFNVDGAMRGKPRQAVVEGVLHNEVEVVLVWFSENVGIMESNEEEVVAILEALWIFVWASFQDLLVVESDFLNAIYWVSSLAAMPSRF